MVKKTHGAVAHGRKKNTKHITVHAHHARPYRKRHIGLLLLSLTAVITVAILVFQYRDQAIMGVTSSRHFVADMFQSNEPVATSLVSTNGFSLSIDQQKLYAVAVDGASGSLLQGDALAVRRPYTKIQLATSSLSKLEGSRSALTIAYHADTTKALTGTELSGLAFTSAGIDRKNVDFVSSQQASVGGKVFEHAIWKTKQSSGPVKGLTASFSTYAGEVNGHPFTIIVSEGIAAEPGKHPQFDAVIQSIRFDAPVALAPKERPASAAHNLLPSIFDTLLMADVAAAAANRTTGDSEKIAALYGPAVVKVYNLYCMDINLNGQLLFKNACSAASGTGFFVSQDGYLATNGHVSSANPKDIAIYNSILKLASGDANYINYLLTAAGTKQNEFAAVTSTEELLEKITDKVYGIDESKFKKSNNVEDLFVVLGTKQPDSAELSKSLAGRKKATLDDTWKPATRVAEDYRSIDGAASGGYKASDVAILKVDGAQFPTARLGGIDDVTQGANMSILGFPGGASQNGLVDSKTTTATLTTGKVSSKKNASGSDKRLIETDTTIGHGNSGGPAFSDEGSVIGIATYTVDGSGNGNGTYNYVRDIKDLQDLASKNSITFDTNSQTQSEWEMGMGYFYESRYSKALKNFEKVKELYPNHNKVAEFISTAEKRIANGEDVVDFPIVPVVAVSIVAIIGLGAGIFLIVRHKRRHSVYAAGVAQGSVTPGVTQTVAVTKGPTVGVVPSQPLPSALSVSQEPAAPSLVAEARVVQPTASEDTVVMPAASETSFNSVSREQTEIATEHEFVQPIIAAAPRPPSAFSVPARTDASPQSSRPYATPQSKPRT